ncbi:uncharacterized protein LOC103979312 isoform X3 [Musa acuminata AAA Group]|uniref:uncharacterized protein LOC103979312 isoform X3 n=1 Tax=Musa acuminata AAA Group TaxID=214697 RepID=UPI0031D16827
MVLVSNIDGGSQVVSLRVRKTIQSIREVVGNHSNAAIYAVLKETNMEPNETVQKLLNQDPFHEVKRRDRKKEHTGYRGFADTRKQVEQNIPSGKLYRLWNQNSHRGGFTRNLVPDAGISHEFRIVRDNRVSQNVNKDALQEENKQLVPGNEQTMPDVPEKSSTRVPSDQKHSVSANSDECLISAYFDESSHVPDYVQDEKSSGTKSPSQQDKCEAIASVVQNETQTSGLPNSFIGMSSSSSDPVHVPSLDSASAGKVGAIQREVGVVGFRRQTSDHPENRSSVSNSFLSSSLSGKNICFSVESTGHQAYTSKSHSLNQISPSAADLYSMSLSIQSQGFYHNSRLHQQSLSQQKAVQPIMKWKPKTRPKPNIVNNGVPGITSASPSCAVSSCVSRPVGKTRSEKLSQDCSLDSQHVIIPQHLLVPQSECMQLIFGSFGTGFDTSKGFASVPHQSGSAEQLDDEPSDSMFAPVPVENVISAVCRDSLHDQSSTSPCGSSVSAAESQEPPPENNGCVSPQTIQTYDDIRLVESNSPPFNTQEEQQLQNPHSLPSFSAYDNQSSYDVPFFKTVMQDNVHAQGSTSSSEQVLSFHAACSSFSSLAMAQQQQLVQQQQPIVQLYPQIHMPHFPNFVPYRHIISPVYVPQMAMPNYASNPGYPHPSTVNSYVLMPGGSPHILASKCATTQYKPIAAGNPTGCGTYTNPASFAISFPGAVSNTTSQEDLNSVKYKDNNVFVPNPQLDTSDNWILTSRELPNLQSAPYYSLSGQAPQSAFLPAHADHAAFNATRNTSHVQYPGLYPQPQPTSMVNSHHLLQQQVPPAIGGSLGLGIASPGPQVGNRQQTQLGHLNWAAKF